MSGIKGIGGVFIYSTDPAKLAAWYRDVMGIEWTYYEPYNSWFKEFMIRDRHTDHVFSISWSMLPYKGEEKKGQSFCINYRVEDLENFVAALKGKGAEVKDVESYPEGKFSSMTDPEGNRIELWEPGADFFAGR